MITISPRELLIGVLLIALIVLVVFLIVLISNITDTIKKANAIIDGGTSAASSAKAKASEVGLAARQSAARATGFAETGLQLAQGLLERFTSK